MAPSTQYHRLPEVEGRMSMESNIDVDPGLLLLDPSRRNDEDEPLPPKKDHKFSFHPTFLLRLVIIALLISSLALFIVGSRSKNIPAIVFVCLALARNLLIVLHHIFTIYIRIKFSIEFRNQRPQTQKPKKTWVQLWLLCIVQILFDVIVIVLLLIFTIIAHSAANDWHWGWGQGETLAASILSYVALVFYIISCIDLGRPSSIMMKGSLTFDYSKGKKGNPDQPGQPPQQVYRDVEAAGGLGVVGMESRKSGADSPVII